MNLKRIQTWKRKRREKKTRHRDSILWTKCLTLPQDYWGLDVNMSQESVYIAIFIANVKINTSGSCSILIHSKPSDFQKTVNFLNLLLGKFLNFKTTNPWQKLWTCWICLYYFKRMDTFFLESLIIGYTK
jgi:hypothetical protein